MRVTLLLVAVAALDITKLVEVGILDIVVLAGIPAPDTANPAIIRETPSGPLVFARCVTVVLALSISVKLIPLLFLLIPLDI